MHPQKVYTKVGGVTDGIVQPSTRTSTGQINKPLNLSCSQGGTALGTNTHWEPPNWKTPLQKRRWGPGGHQAKHVPAASPFCKGSSLMVSCAARGTVLPAGQGRQSYPSPSWRCSKSQLHTILGWISRWPCLSWGEGGNWTRWPPEISSKCNHSVKKWKQNFWKKEKFITFFNIKRSWTALK